MGLRELFLGGTAFPSRGEQAHGQGEHSRLALASGAILVLTLQGSHPLGMLLNLALWVIPLLS